MRGLQSFTGNSKLEMDDLEGGNEKHRGRGNVGLAEDWKGELGFARLCALLVVGLSYAAARGPRCSRDKCIVIGKALYLLDTLRTALSERARELE